MYEALEEDDDAKAYMEMCVAQEDGSGGNNGGESVAIHNDEGSDDDGEGRRDSGSGGEGTGVTAATSKARMWLAKHAMRTEDYPTAQRLATELCQDGVEVEEAKALIREVRSRIDATELGFSSER